MAVVNVRYSATIIDELSTEASTTAYAQISDATTLAALATSWQTWATDLDGITDGAITHGRVDLLQNFESADKGSGPGNPRAGSRVEQNGLLNFGLTGVPRRWGEAIPAFANAAISNGKINLGNAAVQAFITLMTGALLGGNFTGNSYQVLTSLADALLSFRKRRRQLSRSSFER